ncbi:hypothetical protein ACOMHN_000013 [Nucella lapillus]
MYTEEDELHRDLGKRGSQQTTLLAQGDRGVAVTDRPLALSSPSAAHAFTQHRSYTLLDCAQVPHHALLPSLRVALLLQHSTRHSSLPGV